MEKQVIPRLAKRAEGPLKRSTATALHDAQFVISTRTTSCDAIATVRSLAVYAARDDIAVLRGFVFNTSRKNGAVRLMRLFAISSGVPVATISPPSAPASGPMSTM